MMSSPEYEFVSKFLTLASLSEPVLASDYKMPMQKVTKLGVALPALKYKYDPKRSRAISKGDNEVAGSPIQLTLKSVRPPKFSVTQQFPTNTTVYQVKDFLVREGTIQGIEQLKLLLKGKVLHDSEFIGDVASEGAVVNVMIKTISKENETELKPSTVPAVENTTAADAEFMDVDIPWEEIEHVLRSKLKGNDEVAQVLERLKRGYNLTK